MLPGCFEAPVAKRGHIVFENKASRMRIIIKWLPKKSGEDFFTYFRPQTTHNTFRWHLFIDLSVSHFLFVLSLHRATSHKQVLSSYKVWLTLSPRLSNSFFFFFPFPFLWPACGSSVSTSPSIFVVRSVLLGNIVNQQHWKQINVAFMLAKLENVSRFPSKFLSEKQKCFWPETKKLFLQHMFPVRLNLKHLPQQRMFPRHFFLV